MAVLPLWIVSIRSVDTAIFYLPVQSTHPVLPFDGQPACLLEMLSPERQMHITTPGEFVSPLGGIKKSMLYYP
jgi:hypothetical protein